MTTPIGYGFLRSEGASSRDGGAYGKFSEAAVLDTLPFATCA
jgi:hypothetical protein